MNRRITKVIHPNRAKAVRIKVIKELEKKSLGNLRFERLPMKFLQNFLGTLNKTDITAIAAFSMVNEI